VTQGGMGFWMKNKNWLEKKKITDENEGDIWTI
jgi:hypothetical protein